MQMEEIFLLCLNLLQLHLFNFTLLELSLCLGDSTMTDYENAGALVPTTRKKINFFQMVFCTCPLHMCEDYKA